MLKMVSNVYIISLLLGIQLESSINAYVLLTANLDHLKAVSDRLQKSPIISKVQTAMELLTNRKLMSQRLAKIRSQKQKPEKPLRFRSYNQQRPRLYRDEINHDFEPNPDLYVSRSIWRKAALRKQTDIMTIRPPVHLQGKTAKKTHYTPRSNVDRNRLMSGEQLGSKESLEAGKGIMALKNTLKKNPNVSSDYEDILKYVHIAEDHNKADRELRGGSD